MDSTTTAAMKDLILVLCDRLKSRDPSLEWKDVLPSDRPTTTRSIFSLTFAPDHIIQDIRHEINAAIMAVREQHNRCLPVNALPPELLAKIFQEVFQFYHWDDPKDMRTNLSLVCRQWNRLVLDSPALWTRWFLSPKELEYFRRARGLSKSLGLELSCSFLNLRMWDLINEEVHRWQDVKLSALNPGPATYLRDQLGTLGNQSAPKLRKISFNIPDLSYPLDIFDPNDPCDLEELILDDTPVVWDRVNFQRLRYLHICDIFFMGPSKVQLLGILERSRELEYLTLRDILFSTELPMPSQPVFLPRLSSLTLLSPDLSSDFLVRMIRFPQCKQMVIQGIQIPTDPNSISSLAHLTNVIGSAIKVSQTTLYIKDNGFKITTNSGIEVNTRGDPQAGLSWFIDGASAALDASPTVTLNFSINFPYDWTMQTISRLGQLRGVTSLHFLGGIPLDNDSNPLDCLNNLGDQIRHTFPRLDTLACSVNTTSELESLHKVVLRRNQTITAQDNTAISPLREVLIEHDDDCGLEGCCYADFDQIRALIPGGNLTIRPGRGRAEAGILIL